MATVPTCEELLAQLLKRKAGLEQVMGSGVAEIDQPQLGRTAYRPIPEIQASLQHVNAQINDLMVQCGLGDPTAAARRRRGPVYPVVQEI